MGNKDKDQENSDGGAMRDAADTVCDACHASWNLSHARETALSRQIMEAITRETAKVTAHFQAILDEKGILSLPTSLNVISRAAGIKAMPPPLTELGIKLSIRDDNGGQKSLDMPWK